MEEYIKNFMVLAGLVGVFTGVLTKYLREQSTQRKKALNVQNETNTQLERLNTNMEHQFVLLKKDFNNNFNIVDNNFAIVNGDIVEIKKVVFEKEKGSPLPLRQTERI